MPPIVQGTLIKIDNLRDYLLGATDQDLDNIANALDYGAVGGSICLSLIILFSYLYQVLHRFRATTHGNKY